MRSSLIVYAPLMSFLSSFHNCNFVYVATVAYTFSTNDERHISTISIFYWAFTTSLKSVYVFMCVGLCNYVYLFMYACNYVFIIMYFMYTLASIGGGG